MTAITDTHATYATYGATGIKVVGPNQAGKLSDLTTNGYPDYAFFNLSGKTGDTFQVWFKTSSNGAVATAGLGFEKVTTAKVVAVGTHNNLGAAWRTTTVIKPEEFDIDGDNAYGSDGYYCTFRDSNTTPIAVYESLPSYISGVSVASGVNKTSPDPSGYARLDNPTLPISYTVDDMPLSGLWYKSAGGAPQYIKFFTVTLAESAKFILTTILDTHGNTATYGSPSIKVMGPGTVAELTQTDVNYVPDYAFFEISGNAGDSFEIWLMTTSNGAAAIAGLGFEGQGESAIVGDLDVDGDVDFNDLDIFVNDWLQCTTPGVAGCVGGGNIPPLLNKEFKTPEISTITLDGNLGDWSEASVWSDAYGVWYGGGLSSTTKARFAWNNSNDMLYVAVQTTETSAGGGGRLIFGVSLNPNTKTWVDSDGSQLAFEINGTGGVNVFNEIALYGGPAEVTTRVAGGYSKNAGVTTYELAIPLWDNWLTANATQNLLSGGTIYIYAMIEDGFSGSAGDAMTVDGYNPVFANKAISDYGAKLLLVDNVVCGDWGYALADLNTDCRVDLVDLAKLAEVWMQP